MTEIWIRIPEAMKSSKKLLSSLKDFDKALVESPRIIDDLGGHITTVSESEGDVRIFQLRSESDLEDLRRCSESCTAARVVVEDAGGHALAVEAANAGASYIVVSCPDWKIIPWENLVSQIKGKSMLMAEVSSREEAEVALGALELGVDGLVLDALNLEEAMEAVHNVRRSSPRIDLKPAKVRYARSIGVGLRVCVDTCDRFSPQEGLLLGVQSSILFLVEGEVHENPHMKPRPFRVNAGAISNYVLVPGEETRYLSELCAGEKVLVASGVGVREAVVGRIKIEKRPLILVEAECEGRVGKVILQDAETIRLVSPDGSTSVKELVKGEDVLVRCESGGRHSGHMVEAESIDER